VQQTHAGVASLCLADGVPNRPVAVVAPVEAGENELVLAR
jgi:hypothetical protein